MKSRSPRILWFWVLLPLLVAVAFRVTARPQGLDLALEQARIALEGENPEAASRSLEVVLRQQPWRASLFEAAGRAALSAGEPETALERLTEAEASGAITSAGYLARGDAHRLLGRWDAAAADWERAGAAGADPTAVSLRLLQAHRTFGDYAAAIADLQRLTEIEPENAAYHYQLGLLLAARAPESALASLLAASALDDGLFEAVRLLEQGLQPDPAVEDPAFIQFNAGRALASLGEWELAAEAFRQAIVASPGYVEAWALLGEALHHLGRDGGELIETALELDPQSLTANLLYALYLRRRGDPAGALPYLEKAAEAAPDAPAVAAETAQTYAELGLIEEALTYFLRATDLAPDDPTYLHLLAIYSINNEIQVEEVGLPAARAAVLDNPEDPVALDLIGYAYYLRGDWVTGLRFLLRALEAQPAYAPARLHLGMLYLARGESEPARRQLDLAIELAPGTPTAAQAAEILQSFLP